MNSKSIIVPCSQPPSSISQLNSSSSPYTPLFPLPATSSAPSFDPCNEQHPHSFTQKCKITVLAYSLAVSGYANSVLLGLYHKQMEAIIDYVGRRGEEIYGNVYNQFYLDPKGFQGIYKKDGFHDKTQHARVAIKNFDRKYDKKKQCMYKTSKYLFIEYISKFQSFHQGYKPFFSTIKPLTQRIFSSYKSPKESPSISTLFSLHKSLDSSSSPPELKSLKNLILPLKKNFLSILQSQNYQAFPKCLQAFTLLKKQRDLVKQIGDKMIEKMWENGVDDPMEKGRIRVRVEDGKREFQGGEEGVYCGVELYAEIFEKFGQAGQGEMEDTKKQNEEEDKEKEKEKEKVVINKGQGQMQVKIEQNQREKIQTKQAIKKQQNK